MRRMLVCNRRLGWKYIVPSKKRLATASENTKNQKRLDATYDWSRESHFL